MKKIYRLLCTLPLVLSLSGCVFDDLSDCPTDSSLSLRLSYVLDGEEVLTLPVERADFFVFDEQNRFVCSVTDTDGPFTSERYYTVKLPEGTYSVLSWPNIHDDVVAGPEFMPGQTLLDEVYIRLTGITPPATTEKTDAALTRANAAATGLTQTSGVSKFLLRGEKRCVSKFGRSENI